eukprot:TRINITY_DN25674_c0_g1_i1.p1 TRINITY_DN25674_c0_g1~~TRINITY_DN25674_c0_g1_i1.p1  ORF type:complete len:582 (-),score=23.26 TRINITY_DN25674_c0_g1_i1:96-1841(-)
MERSRARARANQNVPLFSEPIFGANSHRYIGASHSRRSNVSRSQYENTILRNLDSYFSITTLGTNFTTEILAGIVQFLVCMYILKMNPIYLKEADMNESSVYFATCVTAGFGSIMMGLFAGVPIVVAPGMSMNTYFTWVLVKELGLPWQTALGYSFCQAVFMLIISVICIRTGLLMALTDSFRIGVSIGIGIFLARIGFSLMDLTEEVHSTLHITSNTYIGLATLLLIAVLDYHFSRTRKIPKALAYILCILGSILAAVVYGLIHTRIETGSIAWSDFRPVSLPNPRPTLLQLSFLHFELTAIYVIPILTITHLIDSGCTALALLEQAYLVGYSAPTQPTTQFGMTSPNNELVPEETLPNEDIYYVTWTETTKRLDPNHTNVNFDNQNSATGGQVGVSLQLMAKSTRTRNVLIIDSISAGIGALLGTSTTTCYMESSIGIYLGARTGIAAIVAGMCFIPCIFFENLMMNVPKVGTGAALILTGFSLFPLIRHLELEDLSESVPALFAALYIPIGKSIGNGAALSYLGLCAFKVLTGQLKVWKWDVWMTRTIWVVLVIATVMGMLVTSDLVFHLAFGKSEVS